MVGERLEDVLVDGGILDRGVGENERGGIAQLRGIARRVGDEIAVGVAIELVELASVRARALRQGWAGKRCETCDTDEHKPLEHRRSSLPFPGASPAPRSVSTLAIDAPGWKDRTQPYSFGVPTSSASRASSSGVSAASPGKAARRRMIAARVPAPITTRSAGKSHNSAVAGLSRGFSRTNSP